MDKPTAVIIGGGVIGLSTAYQLAQKHFGRIILLDKGPVGDGSSNRAAGIITRLLWCDAAVTARVRSLELFKQLSEELEGYRFQDVGTLDMFTTASWGNTEKMLPMYDRLGVPYEILDSDEVHCRWPNLQPDRSIRSLFDPDAGYSEPHEYVPALARRVRELGVDVREHQQVTGLIDRGGRAAGVQTTDGPIQADAVVCTVHAWTQVVLKDLGIQYPYKCFVHQRYVTHPLEKSVRLPAVNAHHLDGYVRPATDGRLLLGHETKNRMEYPVCSANFHMSELTAASDEIRKCLINNFRSLAPAVGTIRWESEKVGLICFAMDGEPILGPVDALKGLFVGCNFHSGGFAYNPVAGLLLAEFIADGKTSIDVSRFSPQRFDPRKTEAYLATKLPQSSGHRRRH